MQRRRPVRPCLLRQAGSRPSGGLGALRKGFPPALLGHLLVLLYHPLSPAILAGVVRLQLDQIVRRVRNNHAVTARYDEAVADRIVAILTNTMQRAVALLERELADDPSGRPVSARRRSADRPRSR